MGTCCSNDDAAGGGNKRQPAVGRASSNSQSPSRPYQTTTLVSAPEPIFTEDAQQVFDRISSKRTKLRNKDLSMDQLNAMIDNDIKPDVNTLRSLCPPGSDNTVLLSRSLNALGHTISTDRVARYDEGLALQKEAMQLNKNYYGKFGDHEALATSLHRVGTTVLNHARVGDGGGHEEAVGLLEQALAMRRRLFDSGKTSDTSELCASLNSLGIAYEWVNKDEEGNKLQKEALDIYLKLHPDKKEREDVSELLNAFSGVVSPRKNRANSSHQNKPAANDDLLFGGGPKEQETTASPGVSRQGGDGQGNPGASTDESASWL